MYLPPFINRVCYKVMNYGTVILLMYLLLCEASVDFGESTSSGHYCPISIFGLPPPSSSNKITFFSDCFLMFSFMAAKGLLCGYRADCLKKKKKGVFTIFVASWFFYGKTIDISWQEEGNAWLFDTMFHFMIRKMFWIRMPCASIKYLNAFFFPELPLWVCYRSGPCCRAWFCSWFVT